MRETIVVRNLIEPFDTCYGVAKSKLINMYNENDKQDKANKRAANIAIGTGDRSATWDESRVSCILLRASSLNDRRSTVPHLLFYCS